MANEMIGGVKPVNRLFSMLQNQIRTKNQVILLKIQSMGT